MGQDGVIPEKNAKNVVSAHRADTGPNRRLLDIFLRDATRERISEVLQEAILDAAMKDDVSGVFCLEQYQHHLSTFCTDCEVRRFLRGLCTEMKRRQVGLCKTFTTALQLVTQGWFVEKRADESVITFNFMKKLYEPDRLNDKLGGFMRWRMESSAFWHECPFEKQSEHLRWWVEKSGYAESSFSKELRNFYTELVNSKRSYESVRRDEENAELLGDFAEKASDESKKRLAETAKYLLEFEKAKKELRETMSAIPISLSREDNHAGIRMAIERVSTSVSGHARNLTSGYVNIELHKDCDSDIKRRICNMAYMRALDWRKQFPWCDLSVEIRCDTGALASYIFPEPEADFRD